MVGTSITIYEDIKPGHTTGENRSYLEEFGTMVSDQEDGDLIIILNETKQPFHFQGTTCRCTYTTHIEELWNW